MSTLLFSVDMDAHCAHAWRVSKVYVTAGEPCFRGQRLIAFQTLEDAERKAPEPDGYVLLGDDDDDEENSMEKPQEATGWQYICYEDSESNAGITQNVFVAPGMRLTLGQELCTIQPSPKLAYLLAADLESSRQRAQRTVGDWKENTLNGRFQRLVKRFATLVVTGTREAIRSDELAQVCQELERVTREFSDRAMRYAQIILHEMHDTDAQERCVRPLDFMGGQLGGKKYVVADVLFKFGADESFSAYPNPLDIAAKIQGHELKGAKAYFSSFFNDGLLEEISFPLISIIDHCGFRITAMSVLPINGTSLVYGSDDAGQECHVKTLDTEFYELVTDASLRLNLREHIVADGRSSGRLVKIVSACDLEGHRGIDGNKYLLDFSRALPCAHKEGAAEHDRHWPFYHMLRAEFLQSYPKALSADAWSNFQKKNGAELNADVAVATQFLMTNVVNTVAEVLIKWKESDKLSLSLVFHQNGLNMRYLGLVYRRMLQEALPPSQMRVMYVLIVDALARSMKRRMRQVMRQQRLDLCSNELNMLFITFQRADQWLVDCAFVLESLQEDFHFEEAQAREAVTAFHRSTQIKFRVLVALSASTGLGILASVMNDLASADGLCNGRAFDTTAFIFEESDLFFAERVKPLDIVDRVVALNLYTKGLKNKDRYSVAVQYFLRALGLVKGAVASNPLDCSLIMLQADICHELWEIMRFRKEDVDAGELSRLFSAMADKLYRRALSLKPVKVQLLARRNYAKFLLRSNRLFESERIIKEAIAGTSGSDDSMPANIREEFDWIMGQVLICNSGGDDEALAESVGGASSAVNMSPALSGARGAPNRRGSAVSSNSLKKGNSQNNKMIKSIRRLSRVGADFAGSLSALGGLFEASAIGSSPILEGLGVVDDSNSTADEGLVEAERNKRLLEFFRE